jgi:hypothetical protein
MIVRLIANLGRRVRGYGWPLKNARGASSSLFEAIKAKSLLFCAGLFARGCSLKFFRLCLSSFFAARLVP